MIDNHHGSVFTSDIESALNIGNGNGKVYFFKGDEYQRFDIANFRVDPGYPLKTAVYWKGVPF